MICVIEFNYNTLKWGAYEALCVPFSVIMCLGFDDRVVYVGY